MRRWRRPTAYESHLSRASRTTLPYWSQATRRAFNSNVRMHIGNDRMNVCRARTAPPVMAPIGQQSPSKISGITTLRTCQLPSKTCLNVPTLNPLLAKPSARSWHTRNQFHNKQAAESRGTPVRSPAGHQIHRLCGWWLCLWHNRLRVWQYNNLCRKSSRICLVPFSAVVYVNHDNERTFRSTLVTNTCGQKVLSVYDIRTPRLSSEVYGRMNIPLKQSAQRLIFSKWSNRLIEMRSWVKTNIDRILFMRCHPNA
jgi:hypothetical protein